MSIFFDSADRKMEWPKGMIYGDMLKMVRVDLRSNNGLWAFVGFSVTYDSDAVKRNLEADLDQVRIKEGTLLQLSKVDKSGYAHYRARFGQAVAEVVLMRV